MVARVLMALDIVAVMERVTGVVLVVTVGGATSSSWKMVKLRAAMTREEEIWILVVSGKQGGKRSWLCETMATDA